MRIILLIWTALMSSALYGQNLRFQHLTTADGLAQNMVDCMLQDQQGYIWLGTWNGLCKYDGYSFETFDSQSSSNATLGNNFVYALHEDNFGNIWVGTSKGLYLYLYEQKTFRAVDLTSHQISKNLSYQSIASINGDQILVGTSQGLIHLRVLDSEGQMQFIQYLPFEGADIGISEVLSLRQDSKGDVWIGTDAGLFRADADLNINRRYRFDAADVQSISSDIINDVFETKDGQIWIACEIGLNLYDPLRDSFQRYYNDPLNPHSLIHNTVMDIVEHGGQLYLATLGGLTILNRGTGRFTNYRNNPKDNFSINNDFLNCLLVDREENIWTGSERGGVNIINSRQNTFEQVKFEIGNPNSLSHSTVNSVYEEDPYLWVGTAGGGLNRIHKKTGKFVHYRNGQIASDFVTKIYPMKNDELWVGTWGQGINVLKNAGKANETIGLISVETGSVGNNFVSSILEDKWGYVWVGTLGGLYRLDRSIGSYLQVQPTNHKFAISQVGCLLMDSQSNLWVGTREGLYCLNPLHPNQNIEVFRADESKANSISDNYVISLIEDHRGNLWAGTYGGGINKISIRDEEVEISQYDTRSGLSNNIVFGIEEGEDHSLWLSTDYGLSRFNPATESCRNFYISDGLLNNQYYWSASFKSKDGKLFFGGMNGVDILYPEWISDQIEQPTVVITDLKLLGQSVVPNQDYNGVTVSSDLISYTSSIDLSYKEKIVSFEFSTFNFLESDLISYSYLLEGFDQQWNQIGPKRHIASYTNLKPGQYTFKVKAAGPNGIFSSEPTELRINIKPPFWQTIWFQVLGVVLLASAVFGYVRYRTYSLKRQKAVLAKQVQERTEEINRQKEALTFQSIQLQKTNETLEEKQKYIEGQNKELESKNVEIGERRDELLELNNKLKLVSQLRLSFFTNISHEFRTPLTLIIGPLERLMSHYSFGEEVKNNLEVINRNAKRLLHLINEIMDFRKIEQGKAELKVSQGNIEDFTRKIYEAFAPLAEIKSIDFSFRSTSEGQEIWFDAEKIENVLYNLLSNAFKYTPNNGRVSVELSVLDMADSKLQLGQEEGVVNQKVMSIKVIDSGSGISEENLPLIFKRFYRIESENAFKVGGSGIGLAITEELIKTHHGEIFVSSELGQGSVFEIQFPSLGSAGRELSEQPADHSNIHSQVEILKNELMIRQEEPAEKELVVVDSQKPTVLVVEDNLDLRKFISLRLSETYNIVEASNGAKGLVFAEKYNPDLIVSDVMMPEMDGFEMCTTIKNNFSTSHIPVILLTAKSSVENQIEGLQIGADDYLPKPFNFELLEARIANLIATRRKLKEQYQQGADIQPKALTQNAKDQKFLEQALRVVEEQLSNSEFGSKDLVTTLGISRSLLHKKLTSLTGQSASEFINHFKMNRSKELLRVGDKNISEVAYAVGYNDPKYFSRLFSKHFGYSPKEYQEKAIS